MPGSDIHIMANGMVVVGERMEAVQTVAFGVMLPAGASRLPEGFCGAANVLADWVFRGAGTMDSRQLGDALDGLGLHRHTAVDASHLCLGAVMEASNLYRALELYADILLRPWLEPQQFEPARQLAVDDLKALQDDPQQKVLLEVRERFYPYPLGRSTAGRMDQLQALTAEAVAGLAKRHLAMGQSILAIAGRYDFDTLCARLEDTFAGAPTACPGPVQLGPRGPTYTHIRHHCSQVHIGLMVPVVGPRDPDYYNARVAISVLGGGMSSRLFTEVREKRGLCYSVSARYHCLKDHAGMVCYAGTTPDKAQQAVDLIIDQFRSLARGLTEQELARARAGLKSALILHSESSARRASAIGADYYLLGRVRDLDEIKRSIDAVTVESVTRYLSRRPLDSFTAVTIGPRPIVLHAESSNGFQAQEIA